VTPNAERTGVIFGVDTDVPQVGGNAAQRRELDKRRGAGTMTRSGAQCFCCPTIMTSEDIRLEVHAGRLSSVLMSTIVDGPDGKEYRVPSDLDVAVSKVTEEELESLFCKIPFGLLLEPISPVRPSPNTRGASGLPRYAIDSWQKVFSPRQRETLGVFSLSIRDMAIQLDKNGYPRDYAQAIVAYSCSCLSRLADRGSEITTWQTNAEKLGHTFARFVIPFTTDFTESNPIADSSGGFIQAVEWVSSLTNATKRTVNAGSTLAKRRDNSRRAETPLALSLAPGLPVTVS
jgi:putative DNA methylase